MNNEIFNHKELKEIRKKLRNGPTAPENVLWSKIRAKQLNGCKFRRQQGIGEYIVDFYCPEIKLIIEIDGDSHYEDDGQINDMARDDELRSLGLSILRFTNKDVTDNINGVLETIVSKITTLNPSFKRREACSIKTPPDSFPQGPRRVFKRREENNCKSSSG